INTLVAAGPGVYPELVRVYCQESTLLESVTVPSPGGISDLDGGLRQTGEPGKSRGDLPHGSSALGGGQDAIRISYAAGMDSLVSNEVAGCCEDHDVFKQ